MAHKEHGGAISKEVGDEDDRRLYECARKYETIVKQFDELMGMFDDEPKSPKKRKGRKGSTSGAKASSSASSNQPNNKALVETVTRFLHELGTTPSDSECPRNTKD